MTINGVFRVHRDRDPDAYQDKYDGARIKRNNTQHVIHVAAVTSGFHAILPSIDALLKSVVPQDIPVHALVNMVNSGLRDLSITASRSNPDYKAKMSKIVVGKLGNVVEKEMEDLGVKDLPDAVCKQAFVLLAEATKGGKGMQIAEMGSAITHPDGRKEYKSMGYMLNGTPVPLATKPFFDFLAKNKVSKQPKEGPYQDFLLDIVKNPEQMSNACIEKIFASPKDYPKHLVTAALLSRAARGPPAKPNGEGAQGKEVPVDRKGKTAEAGQAGEGQCQIS